jgi:glucan phosphoethanolaminetransferase (alkaline phosphatase superfamily)
MDSLKQLQVPATLVYTSDHGDNLNDCGDGNWLHAVKEMTPFEVQVPLFWFFNPPACQAHAPAVKQMLTRAGAEVSHDNIDKTLLGLVGIKDEGIYDASLDLGAEAFRPQARFAINRRREVVDVNQYLTKFDRHTHCPVRAAP